MSRKIRFAVALTLAVLTCGSLGALPLGSPIASAERGDFLTAIVEWIVSVFVPEQPSEGAPKPAQLKDNGTMDPNGGTGGGH
ncbi:MAG TPA: hypothetical protein VGX68_02770 [Thermoanaerobaculia bacterium]|jgi:hypothetical protein|nr:hypothetical protein [Thermoanaerobaculia bacterium]